MEIGFWLPLLPLTWWHLTDTWQPNSPGTSVGSFFLPSNIYPWINSFTCLHLMLLLLLFPINITRKYCSSSHICQIKASRFPIMTNKLVLKGLKLFQLLLCYLGETRCSAHQRNVKFNRENLGVSPLSKVSLCLRGYFTPHINREMWKERGWDSGFT